MKKYLITLAAFLAVTSTAHAIPTTWDWTGSILRPLQSMWNAGVQVPWITATSTTATSTFPIASTTTFCIGSECRTDWPTGGGTSTVYLASTTSGFTPGNAAFVASNGQIGSVATGTLTETATGLSLDATRGLFGGSAVLSLDAGYTIPTTTLVQSASSFFANPASLCTSITGSAGLCDGIDDTAAGGSGLATTAPWTVGELAQVASQGAVRSIATSSLGLSPLFTTSATLAALLSDEVGTGAAVFNTNPSFTGTSTFAGDLVAAGETQIRIGRNPTRPLISTSTRTITVGVGKNYATIQEALDQVPYLTLHQYRINIDPGTYDEDIIVWPSVGSRIRKGGTETVPLIITGSTTNPTAVTVGSIFVQSPNAGEYFGINGIAVSRDNPYDNEGSAISIYGTDDAELNNVVFTGSIPRGITCYASRCMIGENVNFGSGVISGEAMVAKRHGSIATQGDAVQATGNVGGYAYQAQNGRIEYNSSSSSLTGDLGLIDTSIERRGQVVDVNTRTSYGLNNVFSTTGKFGFGTTSPIANLEVVSSDGVTKLRIGENTGTDSAWEIRSHNSTPNSGLTIWGGVTGQENTAMVFDLDGNVGVGTFFPTTRFHINGGLRLTGTFADSTNATGTLGQVLQSTGTSTIWVATSTLGISGAPGASTVYLASTSPWTTGSLARIAGDGTLTGVATSALALLITDTVGTLTETRGGTNQTTYATGDILYASSANTLAKRTIGNTGDVLSVVGGVPTWVATSTLGISGGSGTVYLATTSTWTTGNLARVASNGTVDSVATSSLGLSPLFTTSADLAALLSDETGTAGSVVFSAGPTLTGTTTTTNISSSGGIRLSGFGTSNARIDSPGTMYLNAGFDNGGNEDLELRTNNTTRLMIKNGGNIGLSTTSPVARLSVVGASSGIIATLADNVGTKFMEMLNTGITTLLGTWDYTLAILKIPNGTAPVADDAGEIAHDTTGNQLIVDDYVVPLADQKIWSTTIGSTSPAFISGGLLPVPTQIDGFTITRIQCHVTGGTSKVIAVEDGAANSSEDVSCSTTNTTDDGSITNATYTASELSFIDFGATTGAVDYVSISVFGNWARE